MLLFHGTGGSRELVEKIFDEGLEPRGGRHWAHTLTDIDGHVFACTTPIGSRGGDPIAYARGKTWGDRSAWLVVVDLPVAAFDLVVGAIPNGELERFWLTDAFFTATLGASVSNTRAVIAAAHERRVSARELLGLKVISVAEGLCETAPDPDTLVQFERAYHRAVPDHKARVAASYGIRIPAEFADDGHYPYCMGCMHNLFVVELVATELDLRFSRGAWTRLDRETMGSLLDGLGRWFATYEPTAIAKAITGGTISLDAFQRALPPPRDKVPRTFWPDFAIADLDKRMREPDTQLMLKRVDPALIVGAIHLGNCDRWSKLVRPSGGQTLAANLWYLAGELRTKRERVGRPLIVE